MALKARDNRQNYRIASQACLALELKGVIAMFKTNWHPHHNRANLNTQHVWPLAIRAAIDAFFGLSINRFWQK